MDNTTIEPDVYDKLEAILLKQDVPHWDWLRCKGTTPNVYQAIINAMHLASLQTPSNEKYWRERCELSELMYLKLNMGESHREIYEQWQRLKSTPIPIQTPCVELEKEVERLKGLIEKMYLKNYGHQWEDGSLTKESLQQFKTENNL